MTIPTLPIIGQKQPVGKQTYATHLIAPVVPHSFLGDKDHPINDAALSGKHEGALVICQEANGALVYAVARGSKPTDGWDLATPSTKVNPA